MQNLMRTLHRGVLICGMFHVDLLDQQYFIQELFERQDRYLWGLRPSKGPSDRCSGSAFTHGSPTREVSFAFALTTPGKPAGVGTFLSGSECPHLFTCKIDFLPCKVTSLYQSCKVKPQQNFLQERKQSIYLSKLFFS